MHPQNWPARVLFTIAVILAGLAVLEKIENLFGYTMMIGYTPSRLLEFAVIALLFVITLLLRDLRHAAMSRPGA
jgi:hypothetical protein